MVMPSQTLPFSYQRDDMFPATMLPRASLNNRLKLIREELQRTLNRHHRTLTEEAEAVTGHLAVDTVERLNIAHLAVALISHTVQHLHQPVRAFTAGCTLPTALMLEELVHLIGDVGRLDRLIEDDHRT